MFELPTKNCFYNVYIGFTFITQLLKLKNTPKFEVTYINYQLKDPENFI